MSVFYDPMVAKLIVHAADREACLMRLKRALDEMVVGGVTTTIPLHQALLEAPEFRAGEYSIKWLERWLAGSA